MKGIQMETISVGRRQLFKWTFGLGGAATFGPLVTACAGPKGTGDEEGGPIKLGFLTAFTGLETILGETQYDCFMLAVDQINADGGIAGRQIEVVREDNGTDSKQTIDKANELALKEEVVAVIGMISSLEKEAAFTVLPKNKTPMMYTTYYEGNYGGAQACDKYYVGMGQVPNQQMEPLIPWLSENVGKSYYVVGSDYIWPRATTEALKELIDREGGELLGSVFYPFGTSDFGKVFRDLQSKKPDICWVTLAGSDFNTFLKQYEQFNVEPRLVAIGFDDVFAHENPGTGVGAIASQSYFMSVDSETNSEFLKAFHETFGDDAPVNAIGEAAYSSVWLLKQAIESADGSTNPEDWLPKLGDASFDAPGGTVRIDPQTQHLVSTSYIGEVQEDGTIKILAAQEGMVPEVEGCELS
jgi:urea transport system substrate-binding protein